MLITDFSSDFFNIQILEKLDYQSRNNFRLLNSSSYHLIDKINQFKTTLSIRVPYSSSELLDETFLADLLLKFPRIKKLELSGFNSCHEKALKQLLISLEKSYPKNLNTLKLSNIDLVDTSIEDDFFNQISSSQILKIIYIRTTRLPCGDSISKELGILFEKNCNIKILNIQFACQNISLFIPFSFCKSLKKLIHTGIAEINNKTLEELSECEKLKEVYFRKESNSTISHLKKFFRKKIATKITHLEIAPRQRESIPVCCLENNNFPNLQFLHIDHKYSLTNTELLQISKESTHLKTVILDIRLITEEVFVKSISKLPSLEKVALISHHKTTPYLQQVAKCPSLKALKIKGGFIAKEAFINLIENCKCLKFLNVKHIKTDFNETEYEAFFKSCEPLTYLQLKNFTIQGDSKQRVVSHSDEIPKKAFYLV